MAFLPTEMSADEPTAPFLARLEAARRGETEALWALAAPHHEDLIELANRFLRREEIDWRGGAEDAVGLALAKLAENPGKLPESTDAEGLERFLRSRVALTIKGLRRDAARSRLRRAGLAPEGLAALAAEVSREGHTTRDDLRKLLELVEHLPRQFRSVVELCAIDGLSGADAGLVLGLEAANVRQRLARAKRFLRELWDDEVRPGGRPR